MIHLAPKLHHDRPQTVGGFKERFEEQDQTHEIAATGIVRMRAISETTSHVYTFVYLFFLVSLAMSQC